LVTNTMNLYWKIRVQKHTPSTLFIMYKMPRHKTGYKVRSFEAYASSRWCSGYIKKLKVF